MERPTIEPVTDATLPQFAHFLHSNLDASRLPEEWEQGLRNQWSVGQSNFGFVVRDSGQIVGGIGAYYADRVVRGQLEKFCNITSWCVLDAFRRQSMPLAMAVIGQKGYHFTDFSPTKVVGGTLKFFKFKELDERVAVILNLSGFGGAGVQILVQSSEIQTALSDAALKVYRDHLSFPWLHHIVVGRPGQWCYVIYKRRSFKGLPAASVLYLSERSIFYECFGKLARHFLRSGIISTHVECRFLDKVPGLHKVQMGFNPKLYLSQTLTDTDIDNLYSETMAMDL